MKPQKLRSFKNNMDDTFNIVTLIRKKRDGGSLTEKEILYLIRSYTDDKIPDYQMSAFMMACFIRGLNDSEAAALTSAMLHSGEVLNLGDIPGVKVDKHSTGGVGDKLSLILAPIVASAGVPVPMISGRGLGHTGGTLDKLESVPGFKVDITLKKYREILKKHNLVLAGQTEEIAPADKRLYALRDVTATVESIPLIAGSIMSKKLAEGIDALVLDVKCGSGAFMKKKEDALQLAQTLVSIGGQFGKETIAYLTNMNQPLGHAVGNWLEVEECISCLKGEGPKDVMEIVHLLSGTMIYLGKGAKTIEEGTEISREEIKSGRALGKWMDIVKEQGGEVRYIEHPEEYPAASFQREVKSQKNGYITQMDTYKLGMASVELGAGRRSKEENVDPSAGFLIHKKIGDYTEKNETIITLFTNNEEMLNPADNICLNSITVQGNRKDTEPLIFNKIDKNGIFDVDSISL